MPRRFQAEIDRLSLLASTAAWRIAIVEVHDLLVELDATLGSLSRADPPSSPGLFQDLVEMRHSLDRNLRVLETAMAAARARLADLDTA